MTGRFAFLSFWLNPNFCLWVFIHHATPSHWPDHYNVSYQVAGAEPGHDDRSGMNSERQRFERQERMDRTQSSTRREFVE